MSFWLIRRISLLSNQRNVIVGKNIFFSVILKVVNVCCSLLIVPITLDYLEETEYGVWLTLSSMLLWFSFFDIGLGNGLRNYLTKSISEGDYASARVYVSTTYTLFFMIVVLLGILVFMLIPFVSFTKILNVSTLSESALQKIVFVAVLFTLVNFVVKNVGMVFIALQKYALNDLLITLGNVLALFFIFLLSFSSSASLYYVTLIFSVSPVCVYIISSFIVFRKYKGLSPSFRYVDFSKTKLLVGKGLSFFVIQLTSCLVIFGASNLFITQYCGPQWVSVYNVAYKYFNILPLAFTLILAPLWSAYTDAYVKGDIEWIRKTFQRTLKIWLLSIGGAVLMLLFSSCFYTIWIKDMLTIPMVISLVVCVYLCSFNLNNCATYLLNGLNVIRVQLIASVLVTALYLFVVPFWGSKYGVVGIVSSMAVAYFLLSIIHLYQCYLILSGKAKGIWMK